MHGLTYGVIRVDSEEKLSVLTVQDVGLVMPGGEGGCGCKCEREYYGLSTIKNGLEDFPGSPVVKTPLPLQGAQVGFFLLLILIGG